MDVLDTNFGTGNTSTFQTTGITNNSIGAIGYMFYQLTDRVAIGSRTEWYKADGISYQNLHDRLERQAHAEPDLPSGSSQVRQQRRCERLVQPHDRRCRRDPHVLT